MIDRPASDGTLPKDTVVIGRSEDLENLHLSKNEFTLMYKLGPYLGREANIMINREVFASLLQRGVFVKDVSSGAADPGSFLAMERGLREQFGYVRQNGGSPFWIRPPR